MKKTDGCTQKRAPEKKKHPIIQKLSAVLLSVCLLIVSLPIDFFGAEVQAEEILWNIISFSKLQDEVKYQAADTGTPEEKLNLPDTLEAVCVSAELFGNHADVLNTEETKGKETIVIEHITWVSEPVYDSQIEGIYTFLPILPESYAAQDNAALPEIKVTVTESEQQEEGNLKTNGQEEGNREANEQEAENPETNGQEEQHQEAENPAEEEVLNNAVEGKSGEEGEEEVIGRRFWEETKPEEQVMKTNDDGAADNVITGNYEVPPDTLWGECKTLQDCELTVNSDITLIPAGGLQIEGNVTIKGGGRIEGKGNGFTITVGNNAKLTLENITIDGASIAEWKTTLIRVNEGGELTLGAGCTIENVNVKGRLDENYNPNLIYFLNDAKGFFKENAAIRNCSAKSYNGVYNNLINMGKYTTARSKLTIDGGIYEYNKGESLLFTQGVTTINGGTFQYNYGSNSSLIAQGVNAPYGNQIIINGGTFQKNESKNRGTIYIWTYDELYINGGNFIENTTNSSGGCVHVNGHGKAYITGGNFFRNHAEEKGGCIYSASTHEIHIDGGNFEGNTVGAGPDGLKGSGAIHIHAYLYKFDNQQWYGKSFFSGKAKFNFDTSTESDRDAITFEDKDTNPEYGRLYIKGSLEVPVKLFINAEEGYVICEGAGYTLTKEDAEQIIVVDKANHEKKWRKVLDEENNQIYLSNGGEEPEPEIETLTADFYSGSEAQKESKTIDVSETGGVVTTLKLKEMPGWNPLGWSRNAGGYDGEIGEEENVTLTENTSFYGIYQKDITLSYDLNGWDSPAPEAETTPCYANVHQDITYKTPEFSIAKAPARGGYLFRGWNTQADGNGASYQAGARHVFDCDTVLYAIWEKDPDAVSYQVEHYLQDLEGDGYTLFENDTETLWGKKGAVAAAEPKSYEGFTENRNHPERNAAGTLEENGSLLLKFYYDRNIYEISFDLNGGDGTAPKTQQVRYGGLLQQVKEPGRRGYNFKGWHLEQKGMDAGLWEFQRPVEENTASLQTTLYAKWKDELAPKAGKASFSSGHKDFLDWVVQKRNLVITVPVVEEGSGLLEASYTLTPEAGEKAEGEAQIYETSTGEKAFSYGSGTSVLRAFEKETGSGRYEARITVEEDFKGTVSITCQDKAGNVSAEKLLTSYGGGIIVEDNAPIITFSNTEEETAGAPIEADVLVEDDRNGSITGGLAEISYQVDEETEVMVPKEKFEKEILEVYDFTVTVKGEGKHVLKVKAKDRAGNESIREISLKISKKKDKPVKGPEEKSPEKPGGFPRPAGPEPRTGESSHVKIYATFAMIAGFGYLLLYFAEENGITEKEKNEIIQRLVNWAKKGGRIRRTLALASIFLFLAYYHSIGKSVTVEWRDVCKEKAGRKSK